MQSSFPEDFVRAFDEVLIYVFGQSYGRENPHKMDMRTAQKWIDEGLNLTCAVLMLHDQMVGMHERHLHDLSDDQKNRDNVPACLHLFNEHVEIVIRRFDRGEMSVWEGEESRWRSRIKGFKKNPKLWNEDMWGAPPTEKNCRAPKKLIVEAGLKTA